MSRAPKASHPLYVAARLNLEEIVKVMIKARSRPKSKVHTHEQVHLCSYDIVDKDTGEKTSVSAEHRTPIFEAVESGNLAIVKILPAGGAHLDARDGDGCTPLYTALTKTSSKWPTCSLSVGLDPDIGNKDIEMKTHF